LLVIILGNLRVVVCFLSVTFHQSRVIIQPTSMPSEREKREEVSEKEIPIVFFFWRAFIAIESRWMSCLMTIARLQHSISSR